MCKILYIYCNSNIYYIHTTLASRPKCHALRSKVLRLSRQLEPERVLVGESQNRLWICWMMLNRNSVIVPFTNYFRFSKVLWVHSAQLSQDVTSAVLFSDFSVRLLRPRWLEWLPDPGPVQWCWLWTSQWYPFRPMEKWIDMGLHFLLVTGLFKTEFLPGPNGSMRAFRQTVSAKC